MIGFGTFIPRKNAHVHLYGPSGRTTEFATLAPLCQTIKWENTVRTAWADLYHDYPDPASAAEVRTVTCPKCQQYV